MRNFADLTKSSLNLDQLVNVGESLFIGTTNGTGTDISDLGTWEPFSTQLDLLPIDIKFPSLINATYIALWGNISRYVTFLSVGYQANFSVASTYRVLPLQSYPSTQTLCWITHRPGFPYRIGQINH